MAFADKSDNRFAPFDDVDLFEAGNHGNFDSCSDINNAATEQNDEYYTLKDDVSESATSSSVYGKINVDSSSQHEADQLKETTNAVEAESCTLSTEYDRRGDIVDGGQFVVSATNTSTSDPHSSRLSPEDISSDVKTFPSAYMASDSGLESSTAVLTLDSDMDSPQRQKTYCDLDSGDGMEVDVAALQLQLTQLTAERDNYKSLYSQSKEENDNYQEQILEVWTDVCTM